MIFRKRQFFAGHALVALLMAAAAATGAAASDDIKLGEFIPQNPPQPAPAISFTDMAGTALTLADFKGRVTLVNLWATWCRPCLKEMPSLERLQQAEGDALRIVAVSEDHGGKDVVARFVEKHEFGELSVYLDPQSNALHGFALRGLPTSILLDRDGNVIGRVEGAAEWDGEAMRAALKPLLAKG